MSKRAEELAQDYADKKLQAIEPELWQTGYSRYRKMSIHVMDGSDVEEAYQIGYEQAEKNTIERACEWMEKNIRLPHPRKGTDECIVNLNAFRKAMEEE